MVTKERLVVTTSWDDGHELDAKLGLELANHGFTGTFYIAPQCAGISTLKRITPAALRDLAGQFEIGSHTYTHPRLTRLTRAESAQEIEFGKVALEDILGRAVTSFCYPYGAYRGEHVALVRAAGFSVARTVRRFCTGVSNDPLQLATTSHAVRHRADLWRVVSRSHTSSEALAGWAHWDVLARQLFDEAMAAGGIYHLWGHSWEIEANGDWPRLRSLLRYIADQDGVRFATNAELGARPGSAG